MYPQHTGSVLLDVAYTQRNEQIAYAERRRLAAEARRSRHSTNAVRPPRRPWWWGLARSHRTA